MKPSERRERLVPLTRSNPDDREVTVYVKGFLSRGEKADHFEDWMACHRELEAALGWGRRAQGFCWPSGRLRKAAVPAAAAVKVAWDVYRMVRAARRVAIAGNVGLMVGEVVLRFVSQYVAASRTARAQSERLAEHLREYARRYESVRLVAHSLGCRQVIEAVALLEPGQRPHQIHLCAPACCEDEVADKLARLARERTYLYWTPNDLVLQTAFRLMAWGRALGAEGPKGRYAGLDALDVSDHFGLWVHGEYRNRFSAIAAG